MTMLRSLLLGALLVAPGAAAETLSTDTGNPAAIADRPERGSTMAAVRARYGEPAVAHPAVGDPPITRWDYPQFSVFFEHNLVLHAVLIRTPPAG